MMNIESMIFTETPSTESPIHSVLVHHTQGRKRNTAEMFLRKKDKGYIKNTKSDSMPFEVNLED